jgi:hypothetical protein
MGWETILSALILAGLLMSRRMPAATGVDPQPSVDEIQERMLAEKSRHMRLVEYKTRTARS